MIKHFSLNIIFLVILSTSCDNKPALSYGSSADTSLFDTEKAIKLTIQAETAAYVKRDSVLLFSYYADDPITQSVWNNPDGTYGSFKGIKCIRKNFSDAFKVNPIQRHQPRIDRSEWFFRSMGDNWMWVNFKQIMTTTDGKKYINYETRVMKKESSEWKIAVMYALGDHGMSGKKN